MQHSEAKTTRSATAIPHLDAVTLGASTPSGSTRAAIRPFKSTFPESALAELQRRVRATNWPDKETVDDDSQGVQLATMKKLAQYWSTDYDWRKIEARLNEFPSFITEIDGLDIHFLHVRSQHEGALPVIITHGWPGSVIEQLKIIDPLVNPTAHGGTAADAFDVVIPSIPGYGFSGKPTESGWDCPRIARAWTTLMKRLGYTRYVAQGGDWGALITEQLGVQAAPELLGIHVNLPSALPEEVLKALAAGAGAPAGLSGEEARAFERLDYFFKKGLGYAIEMSNRPQTLYGIADSPVGLAAWFCDHDILSYRLKARAFDGNPGGLTRDDVLDNITFAWLTNTAISSGRLYHENKLPFFVPMGVKIPIAVSAFPDEIYQIPRSWAERAYPRLIHYNRLEQGGHFAAWEQPKLLVQEMRTAFGLLR